MGLPLLVKKEYESMKKISPNYRGYCYLLKNSVTQNNKVYDISIGYEIITRADSVVDNPKLEDTLHILYAKKMNDVAVVPFIKIKDISTKPRYDDMKQVFEKNNGTINYFLMMADFGLFYNAKNVDGILTFRKKEVCITEKIDESERKMIEEKRNVFEGLGIKLA